MKKKLSFEDLEKVMRELVLPFHAVERAVPLLLPNGRRRENDAEHSWSLAFIACLIAERISPDLDIGKICQFAVVHDLVEVHAGDTSAVDPNDDHDTKVEREERALRKISKDFKDFEWLVSCLNEYERQDSEEARYVRAVDKIIPLFHDYINGGIYYREHQHTREEFLDFMQRPRQKAKAHPAAFRYHEEVLNVLLNTPELFHPSSRTKIVKPKNVPKSKI